MPVLRMTEDKNLAITKSGNTFQDEYNAETIKIILPKFINNIDLISCYVYLSFINQENLGQIVDVTEFIKEYSDNLYCVEIPMGNIFTYKEGNISLWIKVLSSENLMVAKSNIVNYMIQSHPEIEGTIPEPELSILDNMIVKLDATAIKVDEVSGRVQEIVDGEEQIVQPMLIAEVYESDSE